MKVNDKHAKAAFAVRLFFVFSVIAALVFPASGAYADETMPNLLANPGFETPSEEEGVIPGWNINGGTSAIKPGIAVEVANDTSSSGNSSLYVADNAANAAIVLYSDPIEVTPGRTYQLTGKAKEARGTIYAGLRYYKKETDNVISGFIPKANFIALPSSLTWTDFGLEAQAPAEAAYARILLYTASASTGAAYFDDLHFSLKPEEQGEIIPYDLTNLGSTIHTVNTHRAAFGTDASGRLVAYSTLDGAVAKLLVIDVETDTLLAQIPVSANVNGTEYSSTYVRGLVVQPDGTVYLAGTPSHMFKYVPGTEKMEYIRRVAGSQVFDMKAGPDGILIGGTYNRSEAFEYNTATGEYKSLGRILDDEYYAYSVAYDAARNDAYFGIGANARLVKLDRDTGVKTEIAVPAQFAESNFIFDMEIAGDKLFMRFSPGGTIGYDLKTGQFDETKGIITSRLVSQASPVDGKVYFTSDNQVGFYDPATRQYTTLDAYTDGEAYAFHFAQLADPAFPGYTLVGITREGRIFKHNLQLGTTKYTILDIDGEPGELQTVEVGNDGRVHTSGYLSGGNAIYDPLTGKREEYTNETRGLGQRLPQTDKILSYKDSMYYITYPNMKVFEFDQYRPWDRNNQTDPNPRLLFSVSDVGEQDRGRGIVLEEEGKLVLGTVPKYGLLGGALVIYDFATREREVYHNVIDQQSVTAVTYKDGLVYGGSNVWGGLGVDPTAKEAKLFIWDMANKQKVFEIAPVPGKRAITELIVGPDGNIWGAAEGVLFIFDPNTRKVIHTQTIVQRTYTGAVWRDAQFEIGTDGNVYGVQSNRFFVIHAETKKMTVIRDVGIRNWLAQDHFGNFYLTEDTSLLRISIPELVLDPVGTELKMESTSLSRGQPVQPSVSLLLEQGRSVDKIERRNPQYFSSNSNVVRVEDGKLKAADPGTSEVWASFVFDGVTYVTNRVTVTVTATMETVQAELERYVQDGQIGSAISAQLTNSLKQAEHFIAKGNPAQASKHLEDFLKHLNNPALSERTTDAARSVLEADVRALSESLRGSR